MRALGSEVRAAGLRVAAGVGAAGAGRPVRTMVHGATPPSADLPRRAGELIAAQFDTVAVAAEGCDALVANGMMPAGVWRNHIERIMACWVRELGVPIYDGSEVTGFAQDETGVDVELSDGQSLRAEYLVGCDGGRSLVRKAAGIEFPGWDPTTSHLIAEVEMAEEPVWGIRRDALGIHSLSRMGVR